jgi:hypothetical protein
MSKWGAICLICITLILVGGCTINTVSYHRVEIESLKNERNK